VGRRRDRRAEPAPEDPRGHAAPVDAAWLDDELVELERLVAESETLELVSRLAAMMKEPRRVGAAVVEDRVG